ncbi:MAG: hypothetical protein JXA66_00705 [Oligoflexia bacterium]|nr:hypothetical protein [Oligoflexia bacterium]
MKHRCPNCESYDVVVNSKGEITCFTCFNINSTDNLFEIKLKKQATPPPFPFELERRRAKRKTARQYDEIKSFEFIRKIV